MHRALLLLTLSVPFTPQLHAADLNKIERSIRKEPSYQSNRPRYCLLVFGPEATTRVWLVLDGKTLYVDRNGNSDLTDDGGKITAKKGLDVLDEDVFEVDDIRVGGRTHKNFTLHVRKLDYLAAAYPEMKAQIAQLPGGRGCLLQVEVELPGWKGEGAGGRIRQFTSSHDARGVLTFTDKPHDAPIIHFGGPWQVQCYGRGNRLTIGRESEIMLSLATPGLGAGTTAYLLYEGTVPEKMYPRVEITYPPAKAGEPPLKRLYELKERC